jgi:hypothetical protein
MVNQKYYALREIIEITHELTNNTIHIRELLSQDMDLSDQLDKPAEFMYKVVLDFEYKVHDVFRNKKGGK